MDSEQLHHMSLLAKLREACRDYRSAAEVLNVIGTASVSASVPPDARPDRVKCFQEAMVHVRSPLHTNWNHPDPMLLKAPVGSSPPPAHTPDSVE